MYRTKIFYKLPRIDITCVLKSLTVFKTDTKKCFLEKVWEISYGVQPFLIENCAFGRKLYFHIKSVIE